MDWDIRSSLNRRRCRCRHNPPTEKKEHRIPPTRREPCCNKRVRCEPGILNGSVKASLPWTILVTPRPHTIAGIAGSGFAHFTRKTKSGIVALLSPVMRAKGNSQLYYDAAVYPVYQPTAPSKVFFCRPLVSPILFVRGRSEAERPGPGLPGIEHKKAVL